MPNPRGLAAFCCALALLAPARSHAQETDVPKNVLSTNPLGVVFNVFHAEYERAVSPQVTLALAGTVWHDSQDFDSTSENEVTYVSSDLKLRYYPTAALRGFSIGALAGLSRLSGEVRDCFDEDPANCDTEQGSETAPSAGVELDWAWRLGTKERFYMALGLGAKRLFIDEDEVDATVAYPFLRFNVGWAF